MQLETERLDVAAFRRDDGAFDALDLLVTIKSFDLSAIRSRYRSSRHRPRRGSVQRRSPGEGGVACLRLAGGRVADCRVTRPLLEPRGIACHGGQLAVAAENRVFLIDGARVTTVTHPWFSYLHDLDFSPNGARLLVTSSGFDCLMEYSIGQGTFSYEWFAWDHGIDAALDPDTRQPIRLTRDPGQGHRLMARGERVMLIRRPLVQRLPTAGRAAFINTASYHPRDENAIVATLFHEGSVRQIDRATGAAAVIMRGLTTPHGARPTDHGWIVTNTGAGEIILWQGGARRSFDLTGLPHEGRDAGDAEWIQTARCVRGLIIAVDANRASFVLIDPDARTYGMVPIEPDWAVQDFVLCKPTDAQCQALASLAESAVPQCV